MSEQTLASDLLRGADAIAEFVFGSVEKRRIVYHLADTGQIPVFRMGVVICARKSTLMEWVSTQERKATEAA